MDLTPAQCAETGALFVIQPHQEKSRWFQAVNQVAKALPAAFSDVNNPYAYDFKNHTAIYTHLTYWLGPLCLRQSASYDASGRQLKLVRPSGGRSPCPLALTCAPILIPFDPLHR